MDMAMSAILYRSLLESLFSVGLSSFPQASQKWWLMFGSVGH